MICYNFSDNSRPRSYVWYNVFVHITNLHRKAIDCNRRHQWERDMEIVFGNKSGQYHSIWIVSDLYDEWLSIFLSFFFFVLNHSQLSVSRHSFVHLLSISFWFFYVILPNIKSKLNPLVCVSDFGTGTRDKKRARGYVAYIPKHTHTHTTKKRPKR